MIHLILHQHAMRRTVGCTVRWMARVAGPESVRASIEACVTLDELARVYKLHANRFEVADHVTLLGKAYLYDSDRDFHALLQPHVIAVEKFLSPYMSKLGESPLHAAAILHLLAAYAHPLPPKLRDRVASTLTAAVSGTMRAWSPRASSWLPDSVLLSLHAPLQPTPYPSPAQASMSAVGGDEHTRIAAVAAAIAFHGMAHSALWESLITAMTAALHDAPCGACAASSLTFMTACARVGVKLSPDAVHALVPHVGLSPPPFNPARWTRQQYATHVAFLWAGSISCRDAITTDATMLRALLEHDTLRAQAGGMHPSTRLQLHQLHGAVASSVHPELPPLLPFVWEDADKAALPVEKPAPSHAVLQVSSHLRRMRVRHRVQYIADGVVLDVAIPALRVALHIAHASDTAPASHTFLRAHGWQIVALRFDEWKRHSDGERELMLATMLQAATRTAAPTTGGSKNNTYNDVAGRAQVSGQLV